jgi:hypothetical protein
MIVSIVTSVAIKTPKTSTLNSVTEMEDANHATTLFKALGANFAAELHSFSYIVWG